MCIIDQNELNLSILQLKRPYLESKKLSEGSMDLENKHLNSYIFISMLGKGGMAEVWKATQTNLKREVAVKIISERAFQGDETHAIERFEREAQSIAQLDHPNILPVIDYGRTDGYLYIVMPIVRGG